MRAWLLAATLAAVSTSAVADRPLPLVPPRDLPLSYTLQARWDESRGVIVGHETVRWVNTTTTAAVELQFHLYLNAFASEQTTFFREARLRRGLADPRFGEIRIERMTRAGTIDLTSHLEPIAPDDGNAADRTVVRVPLETPVLPGASIELTIDFESTMPGIWSRAGLAGNFIAAAQWFPKLGVFEPPAAAPLEPARWTCAQYHNFAEFYAQHGDYDVTLDLPELYREKVAATGELVAAHTDAGRHVVHYVAHAVHDFAWFADPDFVIVRRPARDLDPSDEFTLPPTTIEVYLQPEHRSLAERHLATMEFGLNWFGRHYGAYPYPTLRAVDPQHNARRAEGMEYPNLILCGAQLLSPRRQAVPESIAMHEVGHQWFYGLVASNEVEQAFLDEGFNSFAEKAALAAYFGPEREVESFGPLRIEGSPLINIVDPAGALGWLTWVGSGEAFGLAPRSLARYAAELPPLTHQPLTRFFPWQRRDTWLQHTGLLAVKDTSWRAPSRAVLRAHAYDMTALTLESYRRAVGDAAAHGALRLYVQRQAFRIGRPEAFIQAAVDAQATAPTTGPLALDPRHYFEQVWNQPGYVDFATSAPTCERERGSPDPTTPGRWSCEATVSRRGPFVLPVEVEWEFAGGARQRFVWDGTESSRRFFVLDPRPVVAVRIDPERRWVFDTDLSNNGRRTDADTESFWRLAVALWHQLLERLFAIGTMS